MVQFVDRYRHTRTLLYDLTNSSDKFYESFSYKLACRTFDNRRRNFVACHPLSLPTPASFAGKNAKYGKYEELIRAYMEFTPRIRLG